MHVVPQIKTGSGPLDEELAQMAELMFELRQSAQSRQFGQVSATIAELMKHAHRAHRVATELQRRAGHASGNGRDRDGG